MLQQKIFFKILLTLLCMMCVTCMKHNFMDRNIVLRLKREITVGDPEPTHHPDTAHTPSDHQDTVTQDPDYSGHFQGDTGHLQGDTGHLQGDTSHLQGDTGHFQGDTGHLQGDTGHLQGDTSHLRGDTGHSGAHEGQGEMPSKYRTDSSIQGDHASTSDYSSDSFHHSDYAASDSGQSQDNQNPLDMTRPWEAPLINVRHEKPQFMPRALPLTQDASHLDMGTDGSQHDQGHHGQIGDQTSDLFNPDNPQDTPRALPQSQEFMPEHGREPIALPQKQAKTEQPPTSPDPTLDTPIQGQRSRSRPRPRTREPLHPGHQDTGTDLLAAAAALNPDVHDTVQDTVSDGIEMIARQQAIDHLDRQLSGATRERIRGSGRSDARGRPSPNWGSGEQPSAPRRSSSRGGHADPLDTLARVHNMKTQADLVQDHVDTVHDIHQDRTDYMYGSHGYDSYDPQYDRHYNSRYGSSYDRNYHGNQNSRDRFPSNQNFDTSRNQNLDARGHQYNRYPPYPPHYRGQGDQYDGHYHHGDENNYHGYHGYEGYQPGFKLDINTGLPCNNMSDPRCRAQGFGEIQIETPHGEMDMEPGELDLEGAAAADLLKMLGFVQNPALPPGQQEININHNVLAALQSRFGINNTAGIRQMSSNRDFQRFMYQVLTHSGQIAPGEYNANLTKTEVDRLLANLDQSRSRLRTANLDHARLNIAPPTGGANDSNQSEAVLTIDGGPAHNNNMNLGLSMLGNLGNLENLGHIPGFTSPLVQNGGQEATEGVAQPGSVAALVQTGLGGGGEAGEGAGGEGTGGGEAGESHSEAQGGNQTQAIVGGEGNEGHEGGHGINDIHTGEKTEASRGVEINNSSHQTLNNNATLPTNSAVTQKVGQILSNNIISTVSPASNADSFIPPENIKQTSQNTSSSYKETDIHGKDGNAKLSKDTMTKTTAAKGAGNSKEASATNQNEAGAVAGAGSSGGAADPGAGAAEAGNSVSGQGETGVMSGNTGTGAGQSGSIVDINNQPIGLIEAGIDPGAQGAEPKIPTEAIERGYKASTAFAIAAITMIALVIIIGPILCLLCKWREKYEERKRKEKAMKNRDVSENNIWDAMMLHEFGPEAPNFVANEAEAAANYYKSDYKSEKAYYDIAEIEALKPGRHSPTGHLP